MSGEGTVLFFHLYFPHFIFESFYYLFFTCVFVVCIIICIKFLLLIVLFILILFSVLCDRAHHFTLNCIHGLAFKLTHVCSSAEAHSAPITVHGSARVRSSAHVQNPHVTLFRSLSFLFPSFLTSLYSPLSILLSYPTHPNHQTTHFTAQNTWPSPQPILQSLVPPLRHLRRSHFTPISPFPFFLTKTQLLPNCFILSSFFNF
jgi:hypothetical protein